MASTELIREAKRFCKDLQYLTNERTKKGKKKRKNCKKIYFGKFREKKGKNLELLRTNARFISSENKINFFS